MNYAITFRKIYRPWLLSNLQLLAKAAGLYWKKGYRRAYIRNFISKKIRNNISRKTCKGGGQRKGELERKTGFLSQKAYEYRFNLLSNAISQIKPANAVVTLECEPAGTGVLSDAGRYSSGETVHLISKNISSYTFAGWYIEDEKISEQAVYDYFISEPGNITFTAHYTENTKAELSINPGRGKVVYSFNSTEKSIYSKLIKSFPTGTEFTATAVPYEGFTFQFWINRTYVYTVTMGSNPKFRVLLLTVSNIWWTFLYICWITDW